MADFDVPNQMNLERDTATWLRACTPECRRWITFGQLSTSPVFKIDRPKLTILISGFWSIVFIAHEKRTQTRTGPHRPLSDLRRFCGGRSVSLPLGQPRNGPTFMLCGCNFFRAATLILRRLLRSVHNWPISAFVDERPLFLSLLRLGKSWV